MELLRPITLLISNIKYVLVTRDNNRSLHPVGWKFSTRTGGHELDQRATVVWKYIRMVINAHFKNQVKNHSKIESSINDQKSKRSKSNFSKAWKEKRDNMLDIRRQTILFLIWNIIINTVGTRVSIWVIFWVWW